MALFSKLFYLLSSFYRWERPGTGPHLHNYEIADMEYKFRLPLF